MRSAKCAQTGTIQMITWLSSAQCAIFPYTRGVLDWPKCLQIIGYAKSVLHLGLLVSMCPVLSAMWREELWKEPQFISTIPYLKIRILRFTNMRKNVQISNIKRNTSTRNKIHKMMSPSTITSQSRVIQQINPSVTLFGSITCVLFGSLNATSSRKTQP